MNRKTLKRIFHTVFIILFASFLVLFLSQTTGYSEYQNQKQVALTKKQIEKFEKDVSLGKPVDINTYLENTNKDYQNKLSKIGLRISKITGGGIYHLVKQSFKFLSKLSE